MRAVLRLWRDSTGAAAAEMALVAPLLLIILFGSVETGNYFMNEHALVKSLRDGARYAARHSFTNFQGCDGTAADVPTALIDNTELIVRKGSLDASAPDRLPNWTADDTTFSVQMTCSTDVDGTGFEGIYLGNNVGTPNAGPVVIVSASVPYFPVLGGFGLFVDDLAIVGTQQAAVTGI